MPSLNASTCNFIASTTISSSTNSYTFSNIPQEYTDLVLVSNVRCASSVSNANFDSFGIYFNGTTGTSYSSTWLLSSGTTATSSRNSNAAEVYAGEITGASATAGTFGSSIVSINNYSSTTTYKTAICRTGTANAYVAASTGSFRSFSPISSLTVRIYGGSKNLATGSTFTIYGIKAADTTAIIPTKAFGGDVIVTDGTYTYHAFKTTGSFIPAISLTADVLVVAGGGGGGSYYYGGGGGAGGYRSATSVSLTASNSYSAIVGAGGSGGSTTTPGLNGNASSINSLESAGGGAGGSFLTTPDKLGKSGGSGGGGCGVTTSQAGGAGNTPSTSPSQGNAGGTGVTDNASYGVGGGGGGATVGGTNASTSTRTAGNGGAGSNAHSSWLSVVGAGVNGYLAGGGGGSAQTSGPSVTAGSGGAGGGGAGVNSGAGIAGIANTGGGGSGAGGQPDKGGDGGSGIVIVRYLS
jgi:hypothetical protein